MKNKNEIKIPWYRRTIRRRNVISIQPNSRNSLRIPIGRPLIPVFEPVPVTVPEPNPVTVPNPKTVPKDLRQPFLNPNLQPDVINSPIPIPDAIRNPFKIPTPAPDVINSPTPIPIPKKPFEIPTPSPDVFNQPLEQLLNNSILINDINNKVTSNLPDFLQNTVRDFGSNLGKESMLKQNYIDSILNNFMKTEGAETTIKAKNFLTTYDYENFDFADFYKKLSLITGAVIATAIASYIAISIPAGIPFVPFI